MQLLPEEWNSAFNPVVAAVGVGFLICGIYGLGLLIRPALHHPIVLVPGAIFGVFALMGALIVVRQFHLWSYRRNLR
jgi:hypothetical protein